MAAVAGAQSSGGAPRLANEAPFLGKISGGGAVNYQFDRKPGTQIVTIAGHKATVHSVGGASANEFTATVSRQPALKSGRLYRVVITALARDKKTKLTYNKVRYMHSSMNRPQQSAG
jgi:hypothetical protein